MHDRNVMCVFRNTSAPSRVGIVLSTSRRKMPSVASSGECVNGRELSANASKLGWAAMSSSSLATAPGSSMSSSDSRYRNSPRACVRASVKLASGPMFSGRRT